MSEHIVNLGDEVRHKYSGFEGTAIAATEYISGCRRITILPKIKKDGTLGENCAFDEPEIIVTKKAKVEVRTTPKTGGYQPVAKHVVK